MHPVAVAAFANMTALSTSGKSRPFDARRDGFVMTEGGGRPRPRGLGPRRGPRAPPSTPSWPARPARPTPTTSPPPPRTGRGRWPAWSWRWPTPGSRRPTSGTSTPTAPRRPSTTWPSRGPSTRSSASPARSVTSTKGVTGHGLAAAGAIEAVAAVLTIDHALIPPTAGLRRARSRDHLRVVHGDPRPGSRRRALQLLRVRRPQRLPGDPPAPALSTHRVGGPGRFSSRRRC